MSTFRLFPYCLLIVCLGCSQPKPDGLPKLYPIALNFVQEGEPCVGVSIVLVPQDGNRWIVGGVTDVKGVATFYTHGKYPGVPAGKYKITAMKIKREQIEPSPKDMSPKEMLNTSPQTVKFYHLINPDYSSQEKSPLVIEVIAGKNNFDSFDLGKKVHILEKPSY
jgi:hypothetical protein